MFNNGSAVAIDYSLEAPEQKKIKTKPIQRYVVGFAFDEQGKSVVLIRKNHPNWQRGMMNGVGGHIEKGESEHAAQAREFKEETGVEIYESNWHRFAKLSGEGYELHCFSTFTNEIFYCGSITDELITILPVADLRGSVVIPNLQWLIPAALHQHFDYLQAFIIQEESNG
jgi:8-oxo-dGTP diphosphatase